jgi:cephalosporin-C deacetylase-like acetyl esterase
MAKLDYNRQPIRQQLNEEYYTNPSKGFDKHWHDNMKRKKEAKARKELEQARQKIKALRQRG